MAGVSLEGLAPASAFIGEGMNEQADRDVASQSAKLKLEHEKRLSDEEDRNVRLAAQARGLQKNLWQESVAATARHNAMAMQDNQPQTVLSSPAAPSTDADAQSQEPGGVTKTYKNNFGEFGTPAEAKAAIPQTDAQTLYEREFAPKVADFYRSQGDHGKAAEYTDFINSSQGKRYMDGYDRGLKMLAMGDKAGAMHTFQNLYNTQFPDGKLSRWEDTGAGSVRITTHDPSTGASQSQIINDDQIGPKMIALLDPHQVAQFYATTATASAKSNADLNKSIYLKVLDHDLGQKRDVAKMGMEFEKEVQVAIVNHNLDAMFGKGTQVWEPRIPGEPTLMQIPGRGTFSVTTGKDGTTLTPVPGTQYKPENYTIRTDTSDGAAGGSLAPQASPKAPSGKVVVIGGTKFDAAQFNADTAKLKAADTPSNRAAFDNAYGKGASLQAMGAAAADAPKPAATAGVAKTMPAPEPEVPDAAEYAYKFITHVRGGVKVDVPARMTALSKAFAGKTFKTENEAKQALRDYEQSKNESQ